MEFVAKTDVGQRRKNNEDSFFACQLSDKVSLFIVADGLGGYESGEVASNILVTSVSEYIKENLTKIESEDKKEIINVLKTSIEQANAEIFDLEKTDKKYNGMGTTVVLLLLVGKMQYYLSIGDSRMYYMDASSSKIQQITLDDTYVNELIRTHAITQEEAKFHPQRHVLTKAVGIFSKLEVNVKELKYDKGYFLLCSDGVTNMIPEDNILEINRRTSFCSIANELVKIANENGGNDNITVIVVNL